MKWEPVLQDLIPQGKEILLNDQQYIFAENMAQSFSIISDTLDEHSRRIYESALRTFMQWICESGREVDRPAMAAYRRFLDEHYKKTTAKRMWSVVYRTLAEMVENRTLTEHPAKGIRGFKAQGNYTKHIALTKDQVHLLLGVVPQNTKKGKRDYAILLTLLLTGLRRSECASLTKGQLRMAQGHHVIVLEEEDTKNNEPALIKLPVKVWRAIEEYLQAVERINVLDTAPLFIAFRKGDKPVETSIDPMVIYRVVQEYAKAAGIDGLLPHGLRASFITLSIEGGAPVYKVARDARHKDSRMTEHYFKRKQDLDKSSVDYIEL